ncbi:YvrJ family protein [Clostridium guangxiense]|uniref:YvrJ family protein n=1 Tax=Clostridium guangxiense TaxID=1662055 RepID=UPI001E2F2620|nr:YvrJ family protein [Clostridium guangxiense]MCD2348393.1 YvrJ family protein [Clostridium guangxiense]
MDNLVGLIGNVGFPIAVSIYLLVRIESKLENLTNSINNLSGVINTIGAKQYNGIFIRRHMKTCVFFIEYY